MCVVPLWVDAWQCYYLELSRPIDGKERHKFDIKWVERWKLCDTWRYLSSGFLTIGNNRIVLWSVGEEKRDQIFSAVIALYTYYMNSVFIWIYYSCMHHAQHSQTQLMRLHCVHHLNCICCKCILSLALISSLQIWVSIVAVCAWVRSIFSIKLVFGLDHIFKLYHNFYSPFLYNSLFRSFVRIGQNAFT